MHFGLMLPRRTSSDYMHHRLLVRQTRCKFHRRSATQQRNVFYPFVDLYRTDILKFTSEQASERLSLHLWWECGKTCNLMSWSSSLLFLLQYGLYRHTKDNEPPSLSDIYLIMIDTREYKNSQAFKSRTIATVGAMKITMDALQ